jgi:hypothetical protein
VSWSSLLGHAMAQTRCGIAQAAGRGTRRHSAEVDRAGLGDTVESVPTDSINWKGRTRMSRRSLAWRDICRPLLPKEGCTLDTSLGSATEKHLSMLPPQQTTRSRGGRTYIMFSISHGHSPYLGCSILAEDVVKSHCHTGAPKLKAMLVRSCDPRDGTGQSRRVYSVTIDGLFR